MIIIIIVVHFPGKQISQQAGSRAVPRWVLNSPRRYAASRSDHGGAMLQGWTHQGHGVYSNIGVGCQSACTRCHYQGTCMSLKCQDWSCPRRKTFAGP